MASTYVHLSGRNIDNALLKLNGIKTEDEVNSEEQSLRIKTCLRCQEVNSPTSSFCSRYGCPLDVKTAMELHEEESKTDSIMDRLVEDPEFKEFLVSKLRTIFHVESRFPTSLRWEVISTKQFLFALGRSHIGSFRTVNTCQH